MRLLLAFLVLAALPSCVPKRQDVTSIETTFTQCMRGCSAYSFTVHRDGTYTINPVTAEGTPINGRGSKRMVDDVVTTSAERTRRIVANLPPPIGNETPDARIRTYATVVVGGEYRAALRDRIAVIEDRSGTIR